MSHAAVVADWKRRLHEMDQRQLASLWRFAPPGHPCFNTVVYPELFAYFQERFESLGGMTPEVSKAIGW